VLYALADPGQWKNCVQFYSSCNRFIIDGSTAWPQHDASDELLFDLVAIDPLSPLAIEAEAAGC
jgi:hypothetical protein